MLSSRLHPKSSSLLWQISIPRSLILLIILHFINGANASSQKTQSLQIPVTSSAIIFTPFVCNASIALVDSQLCSGAWQLSSTNNSIFTTGPTPASGNILPQLYLQFRASHISIKPLSYSNASVNITMSSGGTEISNIFNSSLGTVSVINLSQNQTTLLILTYIPSSEPTVFGLVSFQITVPQNASLSSLLPSPSLPTFSSLPSSTISSSSSSTPSTTTTTVPKPSRRKKVAEGVGITLGLALGLTAIAVVLFYCRKSRQQRLRDGEIKSEWRGDRMTESRLSRLSSHLSRRFVLS